MAIDFERAWAQGGLWPPVPDDTDDRYVWAERRVDGKSKVFRLCRHRWTVDVDLILTGEVVAKLCLDCDEQLPATWTKTQTIWMGDAGPAPSPTRPDPGESHRR